MKPPVKRRRVKPKQKPPNREGNKEVKNVEEASNVKDEAVKTLTRQQWRNKIKNKRRCKNKFLINTDATIKDRVEQKSDLMKMQNEIQSHERISDETSDAVEPSNKRKSKKIRIKTDEQTDGRIQTNQTEPRTNPQNHKPVQTDLQLKAKNLRQILNTRITGDSTRDHVHDLRKTSTNDDDEEEKEKVPDRSSALRSRMEKRLEAARFRYINELLYTSSSGEAKRMFKQDPDIIGLYHKGYTAQVKHWPANPVDSIISFILKK